MISILPSISPFQSRHLYSSEKWDAPVPVPRDDYIKKMTKLLGKKYQKNSDTIYDDLRNRQVNAIRNAEKLLASYNPLNPGQDNPSTTVHLLVKELIQSE